MTLIEWRDEFSTGVASVDYEHRQLIELINGLYAKLTREKDRDAALRFLGEIYARIAAHFALEERIMREKEYDQYQDHKDDHERLLDDILDIMDEFEANTGFDDEAFSRRLGEWFTVHFKSKDARLHRRLG
jgi:hemerythrin-like metal-binding protein